MVLNSYREQADKIIKPIAKKMSGIEPNILSWIAFISAVLAGLSFYLAEPMYILLGALLIVSNAFFDAMDGRVAKLTNKESLKGDFLDHALDRYADIFILGGITVGPLCRYPIGLLAILGVLMTSYMGTQAHAVGVGRDYGGIAGRADRLFLLILFPIYYIIMDTISTVNIELFGYSLRLFEILMIWFAIAGNLTAVHRGIRAWKELD